MTWWFDAFTEQVPMLGLGVTLILGVGALVVAGVRRRGPAGRQAWAEWSVLVALCWLVLTALPAPRWDLATLPVAVPQADASEPVVELSRGSPPAPFVGGARPESSIDARSQPRRQLPDEFPGQFPDERSGIARRVEVPRSPPAAPASTPAIPRPAAPEVAPLLRRGVAIAWLGAALAASGWLLLGALGIRRMLRRARVATDLPVAMLTAVRASHRRAIVLVSANAPRPFVCGWLRPRVVLPESLLAPAQRATLAHVLAHECAHLAHGDLRGRYLLAVAMPVLCWNPLYWWLRARIRLDAELRADARAAGTAPLDYAKALVDYASTAVDRPLPAAARPLAAFASRSEFVRRMHMLLDRRTPVAPTTVSRSTRALRGVLAVLVVGGSAGLFGVPLPAQDPGSRIAELQRENSRLRQQIAVQEAKVEALTAQVQAMLTRVDSAGAGRIVTLDEVLENAAGRLEREKDVPEEVLERYRRALKSAYERVEADGGTFDRLISGPDQDAALRRIVEGMADSRRRGRTTPGNEEIAYEELVDEVVEEVEEPADEPVEEMEEFEEVEEIEEFDEVEPMEEIEVVEAVDEPVSSRSATPRAPSTGGLPDSLAVLELASRKVDADIAMREAAEQVQRLEPLVESGRVSNAERRRAELEYERARRKSDIAGNLIRMEIEALDAEIKLQQKLIDAGYAREDGGMRRMVGLREQLKLAL